MFMLLNWLFDGTFRRSKRKKATGTVEMDIPLTIRPSRFYSRNYNQPGAFGNCHQQISNLTAVKNARKLQKQNEISQHSDSVSGRAQAPVNS